MRILKSCSPEEVKQAMLDIQVDRYGIDIMWPKAVNYIIKIDALSNIAANILKQEMLSFGAEAALARGAITGKTKKTDILLIGNLAQFSRLIEKLKNQPFNLKKLSVELESAINNYQNNNFILAAGRYKLNLSDAALIMGIINITPDSFSGDGINNWPLSKVVDYAQKLAGEGADILDIGGESTRPGAKPVHSNIELARIIPVIKILAKKIKLPISVDTYKPDVAEQALDSGASILNDISALRNAKMAKIASKYKAAVVIMHMRGIPSNMQKNTKYISVVDETIEYLNSSINKAQAAGIKREKIIIDPGLGFGKSTEQNFEILKNLNNFKVLGRPILVGPSRKSFIGRILNEKPENRIFGTISATLTAVKNGAAIVRVHDVKAVKQALKIEEAIRKA